MKRICFVWALWRAVRFAMTTSIHFHFVLAYYSTLFLILQQILSCIFQQPKLYLVYHGYGREL